jgi:3'-phosphoadenosine 5'-phosphosulfate sulfotransferase (PAPS reductase)/FAD synthetase
LEFPEIRDFVRTFDNVEIIKPEKTFKTIIEEQGYPIHSKEVAQAVDRYRRGLFTGIQRFTIKDGSRFDYSRYAYLLNAPFKISSKCCDEMKKKPFHKFDKKSGLRPIIGTMAEESYMRTMVWQIHGCINPTKGNEKASPLSFWNKSDIYNYVQKNKIGLAKPYAMGYQRTGCVFCLFGIQNDPYPNRIQRLQRTHPKLYDYCMSERGLNMSPVLDFIKVKSIDTNKRIEDFYQSSTSIKGDE